MTRGHRDQLSTRLVLLYWLTLVGGLVLFTTTRLANSESVVALWVGALGGTMLGQCLAVRDYRLWVVVLIVVLCTMYGAPLVPAGDGSVALWKAFIPAVLCGFWSIGDRASIAAAWFPAVIWMLSILDRADGKLAPDGVGVTLLAGFAVAFLALLRARETRRVALWRTVAAAPLAEPQPAELLREAPGYQLARAAWGVSIGAIALSLSVWIAPRLWRVESLDGPPVLVATGSRTHGLPCCPVDREADSTTSRVAEYFDLGRGHDPRAGAPRDGSPCRACGGAAGTATEAPWDPLPAGVDAVEAPPIMRATSDEGIVATAEGPSVPGSTEVVARAAPEPVTAAVDGPAPAAAPVVTAPAPPVVAPATPPLPSTTRLTPSHTPPASSAGEAETSPVAPPRTSSPVKSTSIMWLVMLVSAAVAFQVVALALRPLRRLITLRHLRRPFWDETVDQRISNGWQLALVGLRDAGWRPGAHEPPQALARRVNVDGLARCATILERARHGLGIDADDLAAMTSSANAVYRAARRDLGLFARVVGWLRWPLT